MCLVRGITTQGTGIAIFRMDTICLVNGRAWMRQDRDNQMLRIFLKNPAPQARENLAGMASQARGRSVFAPAHLQKIPNPMVSVCSLESLLPVGAGGSKSRRPQIEGQFIGPLSFLSFLSRSQRCGGGGVEADGCGCRGGR